jgi:protein-S-isoprenylcysteine O-methyltransferase Ste14
VFYILDVPNLLKEVKTPMEKQSLINRYLLAKPTVSMVIEFPIIVIIGILGEIFSWARIPWSPYTNLVGGALFLGALILHAHCHRVHKQAHEQSRHIEGIVTTGVFATMRHPMYLSLILMYLGLSIAWGVMWMLPASLFFAALTVMTAVQEEKFLLSKFGAGYEEYMQNVRWRFIPRLF